MTLAQSREFSLTRTAMKAELLDAETELKLAYAWRDERDEEALHRLITAYMRLAISMAGKFKRYGASMNDLIQEAGLGLMKAADKFDPDRGVRFSTYAVWWIKACLYTAHIEEQRFLRGRRAGAHHRPVAHDVIPVSYTHLTLPTKRIV